MARRNIIIDELLDDDQQMRNVVSNQITDLVASNLVVNYERVPPTRNQNYYEAVVPNYTLDDFKAHFRMTRNTFQELTILLQEQSHTDHTIPFEKKVMFSLWMLAKQETFIAAGDRFGLAKSTAHNAFIEFVTLVANLRDRFIKWPNVDERTRISAVLERKSGIPGIIGIIDGCHIPIKAPPNNSVDYYNRNNYHSIILQGVCNNRRQFTDIYVGVPGRVHDSRVFQMSPLHDKLTVDDAALHSSQHLIGDAAYPLLPCLMKPYRDNGHLTPMQTTFNVRLSAVRTVIEHSFGLLKCRFRRLKFLDMARIDLVPTVVTAACVLHNIILEYDDFDIDDEDIEEQPIQPPDINAEEMNAEVAEAKRNYLAALLQIFVFY